MNTKYLIIALIVIMIIAFLIKDGNIFKASTPSTNAAPGSPVGGEQNPFVDQSGQSPTNIPSNSLLDSLKNTLSDLLSKATTSTTHTGGSVPPAQNSTYPNGNNIPIGTPLVNDKPVSSPLPPIDKTESTTPIKQVFVNPNLGNQPVNSLPVLSPVVNAPIDVPSPSYPVVDPVFYVPNPSTNIPKRFTLNPSAL